MFLKKLSTSIGHIAFFSTFLIVSITLGGLIYIDTFLNEIDYNITLLDIDFYNVFIAFLTGDKFGLIGHGLTAFIVLFIIAEFFPKTFYFFIGISHFFYLGLLKLLNRIKEPLYFFVFSFSIIIFCLFIVLNWILFDSPQKIIIFMANCIRKLDHAMKEERLAIQKKYEMELAFKDYEKGSFWIIIALGLFLGWLFWLLEFGAVAKDKVQQLQNKNMSHNIYLQMGGKVEKVPCRYLLKTRNGYLVMVEGSSGKKKAVIYTDNVVYKLEQQLNS